MLEHQNIILTSILFLTFLWIFFAMTTKEERHGLYQEFYLYTGLTYIRNKFKPTEKQPLPTGGFWLIGLSFTAYAFTAQRIVFEHQNIILTSILFLTFLWIFFAMTTKEERHGLYQEFYLYTGLTYIRNKFKPTEKQPFPTGVLWLIGLYFAAYAFTAQRYESQLDKVEFRYNTFTTQVGAGAKFVNDRLMGILNEEIPVKPSIYDPISVFRSFVYGPFVSFFYQTYKDSNKKYFASAADFRQQIITQWDNNLKKAEFGFAQIEGIRFFEAQLKEADFTRAQLKRANFFGAQLERTNFFEAQLGGADFAYAQLKEACFSRAQIEKDSFLEAHLEGADFGSAQLKGVDFRKAELKNADFSCAQLEGVNFFGAQLEGVEFFKARIKEVDFKNVDLKEVVFMSAQIERVDFSGLHLKGADFRLAQLKSVNFWRAQLEGADFSSAQLRNAHYRESNLKGADFSLAQLKWANFLAAQLEDVNFLGAQFEGADFRGAQLKGANFSLAQLKWADFWKAQLEGAKQLIVANNLYGIRHCPQKIIDELKSYGCYEMLKTPPDQWSNELISKRNELIEQWEKEDETEFQKNSK